MKLIRIIIITESMEGDRGAWTQMGGHVRIPNVQLKLVELMISMVEETHPGFPTYELAL